MPAPVTSTSHTRTVDKFSTFKPRGQVKKKKVVRRRGRAPGDIGSDDEIERELGTDSESEDEPSSIDSDSDSDTEPASDDVIPNGHFTPSTSQSPGDSGVNGKKHVDSEPFFAPPSGNWSEMVADETTNGPADLPVIEFADFDGQDKVPPASRPKKAKKAAKNSRSAPVAPTPPPQVNSDQRSNGMEENPHDVLIPRSPNPSPPRRPPGQTARQAYQQRLESDPSYVPTVGGFWGHDDRLLDKDLRSLSGWWRGRWQGRGRGGFVKGRGRGGQFGPNTDGGEQPEDGSAPDVPPIERAWGHDGFEEMKKREEQRRVQHTQPQSQSFQGPGSFRGGRGLGAVRGGRGSFNRGGFVNSSGRSSANSGRIWYSQKPELMWTKQHEGFLYFEQEPSLKPRQGQHQGILVKLPGTETKVVRAPFRRSSSIQAPTQRPATASVIGSDHEDRLYTVHLPKRSGKEKVVVEETPIEDVFKVRTDLVQMEPIPLESAPPIALVAQASHAPAQRTREAPPHRLDVALAASSQSQPEASTRLQLEQLSVEPEISDPARLAKTEQAVMRNSSTEREEEASVPTILPESGDASIPSLPPMFSPPLSQPSPVYGSPFGYAPLPPGIAMNQHGVPYELATGRPVYLQAPPPPPMYNPRPMHPHLPPAFVPGHMSHHSHSHSHPAVSPDFLASASHTPPMNSFIDPTTGTPIFSFPRQTSRIEIRAPSEGTEVKSPGKTPAPRTSALRTAASSFEPSPRTSTDTSANGYFPSLSTPPENGALPSYAPVEGSEGSADGMGSHPHDQAMMYQHYPPQFYYPADPYGYAHNPYVDMSQVHYEMYPPPPEGTVYY
ncbi:hypothetical protein DXG03_000160 [Asterophora parasitica]|uniref:Btz domain-containing protein n=1 Tax=Asterophora parasitica TaxID=117018 RepID=A0A9P7KIK3_9AGAR|nr:hypothetical protein DXG03_000160 [Asterophora parasitica]